MSKHSEGKLKVVFDKIPFHGEIYHRIKEDNDIECPVALLWEGGGIKWKSKQLSNARRLVACWNACHHLPTEALEAGIVKAMARNIPKLGGNK